MKKTKILLGVAVITVAGFFALAADHMDAPAVTGGTNDITDFYAFQGQDNNNIVFVTNVQALLSPTDTQSAMFDENTMIEINIDTNGDAVEDLVIQAIPKDGKMYFFGPVAPAQAGLMSTVRTSGMASSVAITKPGANATIVTNAGMSFFAGPRDDPFFFDVDQYKAIIAGTATGFENPGTDTYAGTNVMSVVVEVPKSMIGGTGSINSWVETKRKQ
ncbi:DUF4331 family protein [Gelidibacter gilvus]|uniref:DUF4331 domain-containing protein n=1 Tax=Gelidibacter gilvus TaxID=59602 RepID=A0A4Q0XFL9_9FLAO|nr:DUF4331 family protein [Gelidibacter gilvus]RXJ50040.1 DUF4331 domain-containing protein [Gelidibacter gilvus]